MLLKTYKQLKRHITSVVHKHNVSINYPNAMLFRMHNDIRVETGRLDMTKIKQYITPINSVIKSKGRKAIFSVDMYEPEYVDLTSDQMVILIDNFAAYLKKLSINPDDWLNYGDYVESPKNECIINDTYSEVRELVLDDAEDGLMQVYRLVK
jgi:hypothetical protein